MDDHRALHERNERFIGACRAGDWAALRPMLSPSFVELDGTTGKVVGLDEYERRDDAWVCVFAAIWRGRDAPDTS